MLPSRLAILVILRTFLWLLLGKGTNKNRKNAVFITAFSQLLNQDYHF